MQAFLSLDYDWSSFEDKYPKVTVASLTRVFGSSDGRRTSLLHASALLLTLQATLAGEFVRFLAAYKRQQPGPLDLLE